ncbi:MAG: RluA family pseudouridine synthase [Alphaproteobacteria bacterium]|nr:RluA family pseudouridine synthase [Alphaproteobacteria bacterium]
MEARSAPLSAEDRAFVRSLLIFEDETLLAFNKPGGLPVQTRNPDDRTLDMLLRAFERSNGRRPRLVHRLDAQTSGVIIAARTQPAAAALSEAFAGRSVSKTYLCLSSGPDLAKDEGEIDIPLARYRLRPELELMRAARPGDTDVKSARTSWRRLASSGRFHLLSVRPQTGRMHQIRVHLSLIGYPIAGDPYYGGASGLGNEAFERLMLHAYRLSGPHPAGGRFGLYADPPADFSAALARTGLQLASEVDGR